MATTDINSEEIAWLKIRLEALRSFFAKERESTATNEELLSKFKRAEGKIEIALQLLSEPVQKTTSIKQCSSNELSP